MLRVDQYNYLVSVLLFLFLYYDVWELLYDRFKLMLTIEKTIICLKLICVKCSKVICGIFPKRLITVQIKAD